MIKSAEHITFMVAFISIMNLSMAQVTKDSELYKSLKAMDEKYFTAYNNCDMETQADIIAEDVEFYHDQGGLSTSKKDLLESIEKNICGKVTRKLVEGSLEVHEIKGYGAVVLGQHKFYNNQESDAIAKPSRFVGIWRRNNEDWQMTRIISLH